MTTDAKNDSYVTIAEMQKSHSDKDPQKWGSNLSLYRRRRSQQKPNTFASPIHNQLWRTGRGGSVDIAMA